LREMSNVPASKDGEEQAIVLFENQPEDPLGLEIPYDWRQNIITPSPEELGKKFHVIYEYSENDGDELRKIINAFVETTFPGDGYSLDTNAINIGQGTFGRVFLVNTKVKTDPKYALKIVCIDEDQYDTERNSMTKYAQLSEILKKSSAFAGRRLNYLAIQYGMETHRVAGGGMSLLLSLQQYVETVKGVKADGEKMIDTAAMTLTPRGYPKSTQIRGFIDLLGASTYQLHDMGYGHNDINKNNWFLTQMGAVLIDPGETVSLVEIKEGRAKRGKAPASAGAAPPPVRKGTPAERYNNKHVRGIPNYYSQNMFAVSLAMELAMRHMQPSVLRKRGIIDGIGTSFDPPATKDLQNYTLLNLRKGAKGDDPVAYVKDALRLLMGVGEKWNPLCSQVPIARRGDDIYGYTLPKSGTDSVAVEQGSADVQPDRYDVLRISYQAVRNSQIKWDIRPDMHLDYADVGFNDDGLITTDAIARVILLGAAWRIAAYKTMCILPVMGDNGILVHPTTTGEFTLPFPPGPIGIGAGNGKPVKDAFREVAHRFEKWMEEVDDIRMAQYAKVSHPDVQKSRMVMADETILCSMRIAGTPGVMSLEEAADIVLYQDDPNTRAEIERMCDNIIIAADSAIARADVHYVGSQNKERDGKYAKPLLEQAQKNVEEAWKQFGHEYEDGPFVATIAGDLIDRSKKAMQYDDDDGGGGDGGGGDGGGDGDGSGDGDDDGGDGGGDGGDGGGDGGGDDDDDGGGGAVVMDQDTVGDGVPMRR
jgi:hypothetical protein